MQPMGTLATAPAVAGGVNDLSLKPSDLRPVGVDLDGPIVCSAIRHFQMFTVAAKTHIPHLLYSPHVYTLYLCLSTVVANAEAAVSAHSDAFDGQAVDVC